MRRLNYLMLLGIIGLIFSLSTPIIPVIAQKTYQISQLEQSNSAFTLIQSGKKYYDSGQFVTAAQLLKKAANAYQASGNKLNQAQVLSLLSLVEQKLGQWQQAKDTIDTSSGLLNKLAPERELYKVRAQVLNSLGNWQLAQGKTEAALESFTSAQKFYTQAGDNASVMGSQINQALALQTLGLYRRAEKLLTQVEQLLYQQSDSALKVSGLLNLGNIRRFDGDLEKSTEILNLGLAVAQRLHLPQEESTAWLNLGNVEIALANRAEALKDIENTQKQRQKGLEYYHNAAKLAVLPITKIQALLNQLSVLINTQNITSISPLVNQISTSINQLPTSRATIYARVNFAQSLMKSGANISDTIQVLSTAINQSRTLQDQRAESYAIGTLGTLYENAKDLSKAKSFTTTALSLAQGINAPDISYLWQWQMGRLFKSEAENLHDGASTAIEYYTQAYNNLSNLRSDLVALSPEIQFSFRESVEPIYRQLIELLLRSPNPSQSNLLVARQVMEALQLAELDNFFGDACAKPKQVNIDNLDPNAAVIYPIVLQNRLNIILKLPGSDNLRYYTHPNASETQVDAAVTQLQKSLTRPSTSLKQVKTEAKQLYDWLIKPFAAELDSTSTREQSRIKTLVFVLDGSLRNIPMAVLYDGERYLLERYAVSVTPTLQLLEAKPLQRSNVSVLIAGASNAPSFKKEGLGAIDNVELELSGIKKNIQRNQTLQNQQFIKNNLQAKINTTNFNIVHLATHGKFSSNPEQTYILDWNGRIKVKDLDNLLRLDYQRSSKPIELLILSACQTASGDKRAALGLAGVTIRAGTRTTLASLWQINDASTAEFMIELYQQLNLENVTKAEALRNSQIKFLKESSSRDYNRPYYWASFILVGNWL
jgi:CHAT domain-containing protein